MADNHHYQSERARSIRNSTNSAFQQKPSNIGFMPVATSLDPNIDYWKVYQDHLNQKKSIYSLDLIRLLRWLRTRQLNKDIAGKINMLILELDKRLIRFNLDTYNDLIYVHIIRRKYQDAEKMINTLAKESLDMSTSQRMLALQLAMYLKSGNQNSLQELVEGKRGRLMQYMEQFLRWTKGLQLTNDQVDQVKSIFYSNQLLSCPPNSKRFTSLLGTLFSTDQPKEALALFNHILDIGFTAENYTITSIVTGLLNAKLFEETAQVWTRVSTQSKNLHLESAVWNSLLSGLSKDPKRFPLAIELWNQMLQDQQVKPDEFSFSSMINGYFRSHDSDSALNIWNFMQEAPYSIDPNVIMYNSVISGLFYNRQPQKAKDFFEEMKAKKSLKLSLDTFNIMIKGLLSVQDLPALKSVLEYMEESKLEPNSTTYTLIADTMFSQRSGRSAIKITQLMSSREIPMTAITYSAVIAGLVNVNSFEHAQKVFGEMQEAGFQPSIHVYGALMQGALKSGNVQVAEEMAELAKTKTEEGMSHGAYLIMISGYSNLLMMDKAEKWYMELKDNKRIEASWKIYYVMLKACVDHRNWDQAERVLDFMKEAKFQSTVPKLNNLIRSVERVRAMEPSHTIRSDLTSGLVKPQIGLSNQ
ncbi:hypothetical protein BGZ49_010195 [Haplosporangium sp. Z 27]|nr:hypothetical protein BGZ49_010195 [Haplosporangium sp. Z 27]